MNISDLITLNTTGSIDWMAELRQARADYRRENAVTAPSSAGDHRVSQLDERVRSALLSIPIENRFRRQTIVRTCIRLGIPPARTLRTLGALVV